MLVSLKRHPDSPASAVTAIEVEVTPRPFNVLELRYQVTGRMEAIAFPAQGQGRADELWNRTCLEVFIRPAGDDGYFEFNFAPSMQWAAYRFDRYREGMRNADRFEMIDLQAGGRSGVFEQRVAFDLDGVIPADVDWRLGLAAVIEEKSGARSYWALAHPTGAPDFHHVDGFALDLPATDRP